jgi:hypothetical protein
MGRQSAFVLVTQARAPCSGRSRARSVPGYTTLVDRTPLVLNLRHYQEFHAERHWDGSMTILSGTMRF